MVNALRINAQDNVVVALSDLPTGTVLEFAGSNGLPAVTTREPIPFGHKVALAPIAQGQTVVKYGASIGLAGSDIQPGQHVHVHNLLSVRGAAKR
jgi:altronate dehydratase